MNKRSGLYSGRTVTWSVTAHCSPNPTYWNTTTGNTFTPPHCSGILTGCIHCEETKNGIPTGNVVNPIECYPNPSDGNFDVFLQLQEEVSENCTIEIFDQAGRITFSTEAVIENGVLHKQMSLPDLPPGFYWIKVLAEGRNYQTKLVLQ